MKIVEVITKEQLAELYYSPALTWENVRKRDCLRYLVLCAAHPKTGYIITGKVMNNICRLVDEDAYNDDAIIFCIKDSVVNPTKYGAVWLDTIIDKKAANQGFHFLNEKN